MYENDVMATHPPKRVRCKVVVVGAGAVGKTTLINSFREGKPWFPQWGFPCAFNNETRLFQVDDIVVEMSLWDTAGQEEYARLRPLSYAYTDIFLMCYQANGCPNALFGLLELEGTYFPEVKSFLHNRQGPHQNKAWDPIFFLAGLQTDKRSSPPNRTSAQVICSSVVLSRCQIQACGCYVRSIRAELLLCMQRVSSVRKGWTPSIARLAEIHNTCKPELQGIVAFLPKTTKLCCLKQAKEFDLKLQCNGHAKCSSKTYEGVEELFRDAVRAWRRARLGPFAREKLHKQCCIS